MVTTLKGPYRLGDNLLVRFAGSFRFVPSNHTCSPMLNGLKHGQSLTQDSYALRCALLGGLPGFFDTIKSLVDSGNIAVSGRLVY